MKKEAAGAGKGQRVVKRRTRFSSSLHSLRLFASVEVRAPIEEGMTRNRPHSEKLVWEIR